MANHATDEWALGPSIDDVITSVKRSFGEEERALPLTKALRTKTQLPPRPRLPAVPKALLRSKPTKSATGPRRVMQVEVPATVRIDGETPVLELRRVEPLYRWGNRRALNLKAGEMQQKASKASAAPLEIAQASPQDWDGLKRELQATVNSWVERQRLAQTPSQ